MGELEGQKLTSPKWNRFKGVRLRWKEKIRLNNVIWRCWHMQFVLKRNIGVCQFASPLDVDIHSKPEAVVLEGKYWKRKLSAVTAEYKRWRLFYQKFASSPAREPEALNGIMNWNLQNSVVSNTMMADEDYMSLMSDTLFSTLSSNQPFAFPDTREIARGASLADFIQPSLVQLQPNLDDYMDMLEPLQDLLSSPSSKLPSVPEEYHPSDDLYRSLNVNYEDMSSSAFYSHTNTSAMETTSPTSQSEQQKFFVKCEQDQPLQLSISQNAVDSKMAYRNNNGNNNTNRLYVEPNSNSMFTNHRLNDSSSFSTYQTTSYQPLQSSHQSGQESAAINYSHQSAAKNGSSPIAIHFNNSPMTNSHHYSAYESNMSYSAPTSNLSLYNPTLSSNYKILASSRTLRTANSTVNPSEEELFVVPKLSQRGRSRSGSNLILNQTRYVPNDHCSGDPVTHSCQPMYQPTNASCCGTPNYDSRGCYVISGHRQVPYCAALLGRRSRTPDHILSTTSNPVGYCKPRIPSVSSQNNVDGASLVNFSSDKNQIPEKQNEAVHQHPYAHGRRFSQCLPKSVYEKYQNSANHVQAWASTGSYQTTNLASVQPSTSTSVTPYIFTGNHQSHTPMDVTSPGVSQMINNVATAESPKHPSSPSTSESLSLSPLAAGSPIRGTPSSPTAKSSSITPYKEHRRVCHINAEQKRRCNIKSGFDTLHMLIPHLIQNPNSKMSKAAMLQKGAEYIQQLRNERTQLREEIESLKQQVDTLNSAISNCQSMLPATGVPVSGHKADKMNEMFDEYVKERTRQNWKFWILSLIVQPLLVSFNASVSTSSFEDLCRTTIQWAEQYCSLVDLRPVALNALRHLSAKTDAISNPHRLPDEVQEIVLNTSSKSSIN